MLEIKKLRLFLREFESGNMRFADKSLLLKSAVELNPLEIFAHLDGVGGSRRSIAKFFDKIYPADKNKYFIELGVELPILLPAPEGENEFSINVPCNSGVREYFISNQHIRLDVGHGALDGSAARYYVMPGPKIREAIKEFDLSEKPYIVNLMKTFVTSVFEIRGESPETAFEENLEKILQYLLVDLNKILFAFRRLRSGYRGIIPPYIDLLILDKIIIAVWGKDARVNTSMAFSANTARVIEKPLRLSKQEYLDLKDINSDNWGKLNYKDILLQAGSWLDVGNWTQALLQSVFAIDICVSKFTTKMLIDLGVSKNKLDEHGKDMTFSHVLNIDFVAVCPENKKPSKDLLGKINSARKLRNNLAHGKVAEATIEEAHSAFNVVSEMIEFIEGLAAK
ncbi:MAG: hypothetical protein KKB81_02785 [Candidatus Margulisbacteria bacterium]|nr:hypothetical protein [Candidatus Margulisiibacteriota bacterium]MBU1022177.1 hypothetical protein [Candidatus Margulisiibacteriota bacterium]MBU1729384.1 hypothetical protein [Candidatus Margulisiibacteriota bacterium]MBU1955657.1 hypothetical protein [Candidatus Margulisiibacteriota bacterium]